MIKNPIIKSNGKTLRDIKSPKDLLFWSMMVSNRIYHINLALQQTRSLMKILNQLKNSSNPRLLKELSSLSDNLAAILASKRNYSTMIGNSLFEIDRHSWISSITWIFNVLKATFCTICF